MNDALNTAAATDLAAEAESILAAQVRIFGADGALRLACHGASRFHSPELNRVVRALAKRHPLISHLF